ncbi:protein kinase [Streptomyces sp. NPDC059866]|uniref:protein kinase domain-containing protein n=1 Tax=Streptomyces sp. NPDC059866 TaxID=3346978 RepID=UPI00364C20DC
MIGGRYRLVGRLGAGGMGTVWKAYDEVIGREVAVKEPRAERVSDGDREVLFARLEREARAAAQVDHPSVVAIHDVVTVDRRPWNVMEFIRGRSLADVLAEGTLTPARAARIALMWPGAGRPGSGASEFPKGWKLQHKLGASLAVPGDYEAHVSPDAVAFQEHEGQVNRQVVLLRWDVPQGSAKERAEYFYREYTANKAFTDVRIVLFEVEVEGRRSTALTMTYRPVGGRLWRKSELFHNAGGELWKIIVDSAVTNELDTGADELFNGAVDTLRTS